MSRTLKHIIGQALNKQVDECLRDLIDVLERHREESIRNDDYKKGVSACISITKAAITEEDTK